MDDKQWRRYAQLLRMAWLNPSVKNVAMLVHNFEREHGDALCPHWERRQQDPTVLEALEAM